MLVKSQEVSADTGLPVFDTKDIANLGKGLAELGRALRLDQDYETKVREQIAAEEQAKAVAAVERVGNEKGLTEDVVNSIITQVVGASA